ncbi:Uncharacterised protein [Mycobacterium tuberculosis]|nr:Uncharacterised protein [Mycobacterium tuberculosis]
MIRSSAAPAIGTSSPAMSGSGTDSSCTVHSSLLPLARRPVRVRQVSAPASSTTPARPRWMSRHARLTRDCGMLPPTPL